MKDPAGEGDTPSFPSASIRRRIAELGYGSGPWTRSELAEMWGESNANRVITEAKDLGWLVSPYWGQFFVPSARDLMVVSWLPEPQRLEFIVSRTLAATGLRFWSFSAWARAEGLLFPIPLFVTDLSLAKSAKVPGKGPGPAEALPGVAEQARQRAKLVRRIPFVENVILVPVLGALSKTWIRSSVSFSKARPKRVPNTQAGEWPFVAEEPARGTRVASPNSVEYLVSPRMEDQSWKLAFLNALDLPRVREQARKVTKAERREAEQLRGRRGERLEDYLARAMQWGAYFGSPAPNENWQAVVSAGAFPYLLVPPALWEESLNVGSSRRFEEMTRLRRNLGA